MGRGGGGETNALSLFATPHTLGGGGISISGRGGRGMKAIRR